VFVLFYYFFSIFLTNIVTLLLSIYRVLQIGPSKFDAELASRIMGPNECFWFSFLKNMHSKPSNISELYVQ
ncbi:BnaAnng34140D, partial [Brassica napus]